MELRQKTELRRYLVPELRQSLNILALPLLEIKNLIEKELEDNPFLEESPPPQKNTEAPLPPPDSQDRPNLDFRLNLLTKKVTLQDVLLRQLSMFTNADEDFKIGQEIIGNIDENGYLKATLTEIATALNVSTDKAENVLKLIQQFEPAGVGARTVSECLLIQLELNNDQDPLMRKIIECHMEDVAKKNYSLIAKALKEPIENIEPRIKKVLKLDPKPGRNYSPDETQRIIPDITIDEKDDKLEITINNEDIPNLNINETYRQMLKKNGLDSQAKEFLTQKLHNALELLRAISKRQTTLRNIVEVVAQIQQEAITEDFSHLKPLTFNEVAQKINMHESTVCRAVMNKYVKTPYGVVALKDFFSSHLLDQNGESVSSAHIKRLIKELIEQEDKKHPLSDEEIAQHLTKEKNLKISRRTVTKYREELKILSTIFRRAR
jgi:RNA polymerase sigma-54 factor